MGLTHVTLKVSDLTKKGTPFEAIFLVDTGAVDCLAPREDLLAAGVVPEGKEVYELADGRPLEFEYGFARIGFSGDEKIVQIIFGPPGAQPIMGVVALESFGYVVDPITRTLKRLHAKPLK